MLRKIIPIIAALLLVLAYPNFNLAPLAWVALIPLFFALENKSLKERLSYFVIDFEDRYADEINNFLETGRTSPFVSSKINPDIKDILDV